jgi:hypothetical protein
MLAGVMSFFITMKHVLVSRIDMTLSVGQWRSAER